MKNYFYSLLLACIFSALSIQSFASHMVGSDISYTCTDTPGIWHVKIAIYRDCQGIPLGNCTSGCGSACSYTLNWASIDPGCNYSGTFTCSLTSVSDVNLNPQCPSAKSICTDMGCVSAGSFTPGIEKYVFEGNVNLGSSVLPATCCNVRIYWQECCRNSAITTGAAGNNFYIEAIINRCAAANNPCNSSPSFSNDPFAILCGGQGFIFNNGAIDPDHDSLTYAFSPGLTGPGSSITYNSPYSATTPMPFYPPANAPYPLGIKCDSSTGDIMFTPNYGAGGQFVGVIAIEIKQWRRISGVYTCVGITRRDFQTWLITCPTNHQPTIITDPAIGIQPKLSWEVVAGDQICFYVTGKDTDFLPFNTPPLTDTTYLSWNASLASKGATFLPTYNLSNRKINGPREDKYQFCWQPTINYASSIPYYFTVTAKDSRCPYKGSVTRSITIIVLAKADISIVKSDSGCGRFALTYLKNIPSQTFDSTIWGVSKIANDLSGTNMNTYINMQSPPLQIFSVAGKYLVKLDVKIGSLTSHFFDTIYNTKNFKLDALTDTAICSGSTLKLKAIHSGGQSPFILRWYDSTQNNVALSSNDSLIISPTLSKKYIFKITDSSGCVLTDTSTIGIYANPAVIAGFDVKWCKNAGVFKLQIDSTRPAPYNTWTPIPNDVSGSNYGQNSTWSGNGVDSIFSGSNKLYTFNPTKQNVLTSPLKNILTYAYTRQYTGSGAPACMGIDTVTFEVKPVPVVSAGLLDPICNNSDSFRISDKANSTTTGNGGYWTYVPVAPLYGINNAIKDSQLFLPSRVTIPTGSLQYSWKLVYTDASTGCPKSDTTSIIVAAKPSVTLNFDNQADTEVYILTGIKTLTSTSSPSGGIGVYSSSTSAYSVDPNNPSKSNFNTNAPALIVGTYALTYSYAIQVPGYSTQCRNSNTKIIKVKAIPGTGINNVNSFEHFNIFPNPTTGVLNIEFETSEKNIEVEVLDILGRSILKTNAKHSGGLFQRSLDLSNLNEGIYYVKITAGEKNTIAKVTLN